LSRRNFIKLAGKSFAIASCTPKALFANENESARSISMKSLHTGECVETCYYNGRHYVESEIKKLNYFCRDFRREEIVSMDKRLFDHICRIQNLLGSQAEVLLISGYRAPSTNEELRKLSKGVAKRSYHTLGQAIDFRLDGVALKQVRDAAFELKLGGLGYYPSSEFIHIDTGPVRYWTYG
jgi:uncharacterized protein YcbK (DUF882 family)